MEKNDMKINKAFTRTLGILALLLFALILTVSTSAAQVAGPTGQGVGPLKQGPIPVVNSPEGGGPVPGGPGFVVLNAFDFKPYTQSAGYMYSGTLLFYPGPGSYDWFVAPVHLPQGATINQVVAYYLDYDSNEGKEIEIDLMRCNDFDTTADIMASVTSSGATSGITYAIDITINYPIIDNSRYSYAVQVSLPISDWVGLSAVRIDYTYSVSLPAVRR
jgi:hypothetical protein